MDDFVEQFTEAYAHFFNMRHPSIAPAEAKRLNAILADEFDNAEVGFFEYCCDCYFRSRRGGDHHIWFFTSPSWQDIFTARGMTWAPQD
jgi:hypothetical protein